MPHFGPLLGSVRQQLFFVISLIVLGGIFSSYGGRFLAYNTFRFKSPSDVASPLADTDPNSKSYSPSKYTDPFNITRDVFYGPWQAELPSEVTAGEEFQLSFQCKYPDRSLCPPYYLVFFHGPTRQTISPDRFVFSNGPIGPHDIHPTLLATWTIHDPGEYKVYAYPELTKCTQWMGMHFPWSAAAVKGSPFSLLVKPKISKIMKEHDEGYDVCRNPGDIDVGRYVRTDAAMSKEFSRLYAGTKREYVWAPYKCKIPPRTVQQAVEALPKAKHFVWIGDSTSRGPFCERIWKNIHGTNQGTECDTTLMTKESQWTSKFTSKDFGSGVQERNISFSLVWLSNSFSATAQELLSLTNPPPTHIVFNYGLWVIHMDPEMLRKTYLDFLEFVKEHLSGSVQHVILKSTTSVVHPVKCYEGQRPFDYSNSEGIVPADRFDARYSGSVTRHAIFDLARSWNQAHKENPPFHLSVVDAWQLTDDRPETTADGRHWVLTEENKDVAQFRTGIGEAPDSILDRVWDDFIEERMTL